MCTLAEQMVKRQYNRILPYQEPTYVPGTVLRLYNDKHDKHHSCPHGDYSTAEREIIQQ